MVGLWKKTHLLRCTAFFVIAAYEKIRLIPQNLCTLHLNLFAKPYNLVGVRLWKKVHLSRQNRDCAANIPGPRRGRLFAVYNFVKGN
jgi:hypothetical protein